MLYLDINKIIIKVMKKVIIFSFIALTIQSCNVFSKIEKTQTCNKIDYLNYEDTIQVEFKGIDSILFKGKNYRKVCDSLFWDGDGLYMRIDVQEIKTGYIHRICFKKDAFERYPYNSELFEIVR
jgi:hypothetical protein